MKRIDFTALEIERIDGTKSDVNIAEQFGNALYNITRDIACLDLAKKIYYSQGIVELDSDEVKILHGEIINMDMPVFMRYGLEKVLKEN